MFIWASSGVGPSSAANSCVGTVAFHLKNTSTLVMASRFTNQGDRASGGAQPCHRGPGAAWPRPCAGANARTCEVAEQELERQHAASQLRGTKVTLDIVMQAPERFSSAVRTAFEAELPLIRPATFRARFHMAEVMEEREIVALLRAIARRGTQGIVLKAPATPGIAACLADLAARKIPVVTYVTDVAALAAAGLCRDAERTGRGDRRLPSQPDGPKASVARADHAVQPRVRGRGCPPHRICTLSDADCAASVDDDRFRRLRA